MTETTAARLKRIILTLGGGELDVRGAAVAQAAGQAEAYGAAQPDPAADDLTEREVVWGLHEIRAEWNCGEVPEWRDIINTAVCDVLGSGTAIAQLTDHVSISSRDDLQVTRGEPDCLTQYRIESPYLFRLETGDTAPHPFTGYDYPEGDEDRLLKDAWGIHADICADVVAHAEGRGGQLPPGLTHRARQAARTFPDLDQLF